MRSTPHTHRLAALPLAAALAALMLALLFLLLTPRVARAGGVVSTCDQSSLAAAMAGGGSVTFNCGAPATITFTNQIVITQDTTIDGGTLGQVTLSGNNVTRLFSTTADVTLRLLNLVVREGQAGGAGGAVAAAGPLTITNSVFHHNVSANNGGAVRALATAWVADSEFYSNTAMSGGALALEAEAYLTGSRFYLNVADDAGGAFYAYNGGAVTVSTSQFYSNSADYGGAINAAGLSLRLINSRLYGNAVLLEGGGLYADSADDLTVISGSEFYSNTASYGGGAMVYGWLTMTNSSLHHNHADTTGGGLVLYASSSQRAAGAGSQGGGGGQAFIGDVAIFENEVAMGSGGGVTAEGTWAAFERVRIFNNRVITTDAAHAGGGLVVFDGTAVLTDSAVFGNVAGNGPGGGLLASHGSVLTVTGSAVYSNTAVNGFGGGLAASAYDGASRLAIYNSTVSGNSGLAGGGVYVDDETYPAVISYTTLYGNLAGTAANFTGTAVLHSSIIAGSPASNCGGAIKSYGYNLDDGNTCGLGDTGDLTSTSPLLAPLGWNGGPTLTHAPLPGSPVIDAADPANCLATDQRGAARPVDGDNAGGARCDMGAYEFAAIIARLFLPLTLR